MTEHVVGKGGDFDTLAKAAKAVKSGDTVRVLPGVYREMLRCTTSGVAWIGEPGAILDGGWNGKTNESGFSSIISIPAKDVVIDGLTMRNAKSRGLSIGKGGDGAVVRNCRIDHTFHGGIAVNGGDPKGVSGLLIENNVLTRMGYQRLVTGGGRVAGSFNLIRCMDSIVRGNIVMGGLGEGINCGKGSYRLIITGNFIFATEHVGLYFNRCVDCTGTGNFIFAVNGKSPLKTGSGDLPAGIIIGDERASQGNFPWSSGNTITGNVVVGYGKLFQVRNNAKASGGYDTQLENTTIKGNTFIAGPRTTNGIEIAPNQRGRAHKSSIFRDNLIYAPNLKTMGTTGDGIVFDHNLWSKEPPQNMKGKGDVYGDPELANPTIEINGEWTAPENDFDPDNYRPLPDSPAVGASSDGKTVGALTVLKPGEPEPEPEPPDDPELPENPFPAIIERVGALRQLINNIHVAGEEAANAMQSLSEWLEKENDNRS